MGFRQEKTFCVDSEGKQREFSNAQCLLKLVFLGNIAEKFNYLDALLQAGLRCRKETVFFWVESESDS